LTHVTGEKLYTILAGSSLDEAELRGTTGILSSTVRDRSESKAAPIVTFSIGINRPSPQQILKTLSSSVQLKTISPTGAPPFTAEELLKFYYTYIRGNNTIDNDKPPNTIKIPFELQFKDNDLLPSEMATIAIYSITVTFKAQQNKYAQINPLSIPYLATTADVKSAIKYEIDLNIQILVPQENIMSVEAECSFMTSIKNVKEGNDDIAVQLWQGSLSPLSIYFTDLFLPVPIASHISNKLSREYFIFNLYMQLWKVILLPSWTQAQASNSDLLAAESVKVLDISKDKMLNSISNNLQHFLVPNFNESQDKSGYKCTKKGVFIFLPPKYHLLLRFKIYDTSTTIKSRTDYWQILAYLDSFFDILVNDTK